MRRTLTIITALVALTALAAVPATSFAAKNKTVKVRDDFFSPTKVKVKKNAKVKFNWGSSNINTHNVTLKKGPKGVKQS
jgi:plastocyanin